MKLFEVGSAMLEINLINFIKFLILSAKMCSDYKFSALYWVISFNFLSFIKFRLTYHVRQCSNCTSGLRKGQQFVTANNKKNSFMQKMWQGRGSRNAKNNVTYFSSAAQFCWTHLWIIPILRASLAFHAKSDMTKNILLCSWWKFFHRLCW